MFSGKTLLITGGTGTFGNAVLRCFLETNIAKIRIFSRDEKKQHDMRLAYNNPKLKFYIGDVRRRESLLDAMVRRRLCVPRRRSETGALLRVLSDGGAHDQRRGRREGLDRTKLLVSRAKMTYNLILQGRTDERGHIWRF